MYFSISAMYANMATMYEVKKQQLNFPIAILFFWNWVKTMSNVNVMRPTQKQVSCVYKHKQINLIQVYESLYGHRIIGTNMLLCISPCFFKDDCIHSILVYPIYNRAHSTSNWSKKKIIIIILIAPSSIS